MWGIEGREQIDDAGLKPCQRCGCNAWDAYTIWAGCYVTAFAACGSCDALYFTSGDDRTRENAIQELLRMINGGRPPNVP